jgi:hypothetical protein
MSLTPEEYERRKLFSESLKSMTRSEYIEIARILRKHEVGVSENRSGIFFDMSKISNEAFEELIRSRNYVLQNSKELEKRDKQIVGMKKH